MSIKKRIKCLICRVLFGLGLIKPCKAGPLPISTKPEENPSKRRNFKKKS